MIKIRKYTFVKPNYGKAKEVESFSEKERSNHRLD